MSDKDKRTSHVATIGQPLVPGAGIEPARLAAGDFESPASTNFTTRAGSGTEPEIMAQ
jgi:hypothetical protein